MDARPQEDRKRNGLLAYVGDFLRWLLPLALVTVAVMSFGLYFIHSRLDDEIRLTVETRFQQHYPDLIVRVRSAHRVKGSGIEVRGMLISEPRPGTKPLPVVYIEEMFAQCPTELSDLASGNAEIRKIVLRGIQLRATRFADGSWSVNRLFPLPSFGDRPPPVTIENGHVELIDLSEPSPRVLSLRHISLESNPLVSKTAAITAASPALQLRGSFGGDHVRRVDFQGVVDVSAGKWDLSGAVKELDLSSQTIDALPRDIAQRLGQLRAATGTSSFTFAIAKPNGETPTSFALAGEFAGRIEDARLPQPLMNVRVPFDIGREGLRVNGAVAKAGATDLQLWATVSRLEKGTPFALRLKAGQVRLDEQLAQALPASLRENWGKFDPRGTIDADVTVRFDGQRTSTSVIADLLDTSVAYYKFPYRLHHVRGRLRFVDNELEVNDLRASANGHPVRITGKLTNPGPNQTGELEVVVEEPIPLDDQLIDALQGKQREMVRKFSPNGMVRLASRFEREDLSVPPRKLVQIELLNCAVRFQSFPYPLYNITGMLTLDHGVWTFTDLRGYNDSGFVTCSGDWTPDETAGSVLTLNFYATDVPIEDELRLALSPNSQRFWQNLHPRGTIDNVDIGLRYESASRDLSMTFVARKREATGNVEGRSITVKPSWLPYRLEEVVGVVQYHDGSFQFDRLQGLHGETSIELSGHFDRLPNERWKLGVSKLHVDQLRTDHELVSALPKRLGRALSKLNLQGPVSISGAVGMDGVIGLDRPLFSEWSLDFDVEDAKIDCGVLLEHIRGQMHLAGSLGQNGHYSRGQLNVDSLVYKGLQLTQIRGPLSIDDEHLSIGEMIRRTQGEEAIPPIRAEALGGVLAGSGRVWLEEARWLLEGKLFEGDLSTISRELAPTRHDVKGDAFASARLTGTSKGTHNLRGRGQVQLREADIYKLPVLARLLKIVKVKPPDETAFTSSDIDFHIEGDRIYFDRIDFDGDAVNLNGRGDMTLDRVINLTFETSVLARNSPIDRFVRPLLRESGGLFEVYVTGTLDDPQVIRGVNQALQQAFPETQSSERANMSRLPVPPGWERFRMQR
jgi:hypothetical protein